MSILGIVATTMLNRHYDSHENYLTALAEALSNEYCAIHGSTVPADLLVLATGYYPQMGAGPPCARRGDGGAHRPGLGHRRGWRAGEHVWAHAAAGPVVHRWGSGAVPDQLEVPGIADQGH